MYTTGSLSDWQTQPLPASAGRSYTCHPNACPPQAIRGVLRSKTIVLVTNALQYLPHADTILWMEDGQVRAQGSYNQLLEAGGWCGAWAYV